MKDSQQKGFALLITIIVIGVVLTVGVSMLDITVKQLQLSSTSRDSELAFMAANAGVECTQASRLALDLVSGSIDTTVDFECMETSETVTAVTESVVGDSTPEIFRYSSEVDWVIDSQEVCTQYDMYLIDAATEDTDINYTFTGQALESKECDAGNICTVIFTRGFNNGCSNLSDLRTVQRELTIDF